MLNATQCICISFSPLSVDNGRSGLLSASQLVSLSELSVNKHSKTQLINDVASYMNIKKYSKQILLLNLYFAQIAKTE